MNETKTLQATGWHIAIASLLALYLASCATSNGPTPTHLDALPEGGFTITQEVRVGVGVRRDFEEARRLIEEGSYELGIEQARAVVDAAPHLTAAHINLGIAYRKIEDWPQAEASMIRALELSPRHPVAHNELGMIRRRQGRFEEARTSYLTALDHAEDFHYARRNLAILCDLYLGDAPCAIEHYERYALAVPDDEMIGIWVADLRHRTGNQSATKR